MPNMWSQYSKHSIHKHVLFLLKKPCEVGIIPHFIGKPQNV